MEPLKGYDFMVNAVWPEIIHQLETRASSVFAPGNPDKFYQVTDLSQNVFICYKWLSTL